jgi:hypothetical protein
MTKKPKKISRTPIKDASRAQLERDLERTSKVLGNNNKLLPQSVVFYKRRRQMIEAELAKRQLNAEGFRKC